MRAGSLFLIVGGLLLMTGTGVYVWGKTRGLRNNNPGNIRRTKDAWQGLAAEQRDPEFFQFTDAVYGIRAIAKILKNYGLNTVGAIIARWAPPTENNTAAYATAVASRLGVRVDQPIQLTENTLAALTAAIIRHENGMQPYPAELILRGVKMA